MLKEEAPGILAWMVKGVMHWHETGLHIPDSVEQATKQYEINMSPLRTWLEECCDRRGGYKQSSRALFVSYQGFADESGAPVVTDTAFGIVLKSTYGFKAKRERIGGTDNKVVVYYGLRLKTEEDA